ncbi:MAG: hypothetical protein JWQ09_5970 [Segetibacter sp.]|nr:hypothetical protein [Segetibacter sp.]
MPFGLLSQVCHTPCSSSSFLTAAAVFFMTLRSLLPSLRLVIHSLQDHEAHPLPSVVMLAVRPQAALQGSVGTIRTLISLAAYATHCPFTVCPSHPEVAFLSTPASGTRKAILSYLLHCLCRRAGLASFRASVSQGLASFG